MPVVVQQPAESPPNSNAAPPAAENAAAPASTGGSSIGPALPGRRPMQPLSEYERRSNDLIELITSIVKPDSWDDVGGPGTIDAFNGLLVVSQTAEVHQSVERLLDMLREAADLELKTGKVLGIGRRSLVCRCLIANSKTTWPCCQATAELERRAPAKNRGRAAGPSRRSARKS